MKKISLTFAALLYCLNLWADPCPRFTGVWTAEEGASDETTPHYYPIRFLNEAGNQFYIQKIIYNHHQRFTESYIVDGEDHLGDTVHTGEIYNAQCSAERLTITKKIPGSLLQVDDYSFEGKYLILSETHGNSTKISRYINL